MRRRQERFRRRTSVIDAAAAKFVAFEQNDVPAAFGQLHGERDAALTAADDDRICLLHGTAFSWPDR